MVLVSLVSQWPTYIMQLILKIAAGILLAGAISSAAWFAVTLCIAHEASEHLQAVFADQKAQREAQQRQAEAKRQAAALQKQQAELRQQEFKRQQLARERAEIELDKAFLDQYEPPPSCINPQSDTRWVKCVDLQRQAKNDFRSRRLDLAQRQKKIMIVPAVP